MGLDKVKFGDKILRSSGRNSVPIEVVVICVSERAIKTRTLDGKQEETWNRSTGDAWGNKSGQSGIFIPYKQTNAECIAASIKSVQERQDKGIKRQTEIATRITEFWDQTGKKLWADKTVLLERADITVFRIDHGNKIVIFSCQDLLENNHLGRYLCSGGGFEIRKRNETSVYPSFYSQGDRHYDTIEEMVWSICRD